MSETGAADIIAKISATEPLIWMVRIGYAARGLVFLIIGGLAFLAAAGSGGRPQGMHDALQGLFERPLGGVLLWIIAAGLTCFAGWRFLQAFLDADRYGTDLYGLLRRAVFACTGFFYLLLAAATVQITIEVRATSEDQSARDWTRWLMAQPLGGILIVAIGLGFVGVAVGLAVKVIRAPYRHHLDPRKMSRAWAVALASFGILTRALVFLMIGAFLCFAAYNANSSDVVGLSGVLRTLQDQSYGGLLLGVTALGLIAFGCFEMIEAFARRIRTPKF